MNIAESQQPFKERHGDLVEKWTGQAAGGVKAVRDLVADLRTLRPDESKEEALTYYLLNLFGNTMAAVQGKKYDPTVPPDAKLVGLTNLITKPLIHVLNYIMSPTSK